LELVTILFLNAYIFYFVKWIFFKRNW